MTRKAELLDQIATRALFSGGSTYFLRDDALWAIAECRALEMAIIRTEAGVVKGNAIETSPAMICDFSLDALGQTDWPTVVAQAAEFAFECVLSMAPAGSTRISFRFKRTLPPGTLVFSFVIIDREESRRAVANAHRRERRAQ